MATEAALPADSVGGALASSVSRSEDGSETSVALCGSPSAASSPSWSCLGLIIGALPRVSVETTSTTAGIDASCLARFVTLSRGADPSADSVGDLGGASNSSFGTGGISAMTSPNVGSFDIAGLRSGERPRRGAGAGALAFEPLLMVIGGRGVRSSES